jgi:hypothetical protein
MLTPNKGLCFLSLYKIPADHETKWKNAEYFTDYTPISICCIIKHYALSCHGPLTDKCIFCAYCHTLSYINNTAD